MSIDESSRTDHADLYGQLNRAVDAIPVRPVHYKILTLVAIGGLFNSIEQYNVAYASHALSVDFKISSAQVGLLSTATFLAMAAGSLLTGFLSDRIGRRPMLMVDIALFTLGAIVAALAPAYGVLLSARVLVGLGLGGEVSIGITVISEISPTHRRGAMTASLNFVTGGLGVFAASGLATLFFGPLASPLGGVNVVWRWWFALMVIPALLLFWYRRYIPESPRYLLQQGQLAVTNRVLTLLDSNRLRDDAAVPTHEFVAGVEGTRPRVEGEKPGLGELFRGGIAKHTIIAWLLAPASFSVMVAMIVFMPTVLNSRGLDTTTSLVYTTFTTFGGVVGAVLGIFVSHRLPRKVVLVGGGLVNALLGIGFYLAGNIGIALACAFTMEMIFYVMYPVVAVYLTEMFPTRIRGLGTGSAWFLGLVASGLGSYAAGALLDTYGSGGVFVGIALMCVLIAVVALVGPETRGRSLDSERLV